MIDRVLSVLATQLQEALVQRFGGSQVIAALGAVPDLNRDVPSEQPVTLSLVRIEEERIARVQSAIRRRPDEVSEELHPEVRLNLFVLATACAKGGYAESMKYLAAVVGFFQSRPSFDRANTPSLDAGIDKLKVDLFTLTFEEQSQLWGSLSLRYVPSLLYRIRVVVVQDAATSRTVPPIREVGAVEVPR